MIELADNLRLREILEGDQPFPVGVELVSTRGAMGHSQTLRVREFGEMLTHCREVDWVSITDKAGGHPQLAPVALGTPILYAGKEVVIHSLARPGHSPQRPLRQLFLGTDGRFSLHARVCI